METLRAGVYITNGKRLLRIERVTTVGIDAEDAADPTSIVSLPRSVVTRDWRVVKPRREARGAA